MPFAEPLGRDVLETTRTSLTSSLLLTRIVGSAFAFAVSTPATFW